jgi:hypothetical protein
MSSDSLLGCLALGFGNLVFGHALLFLGRLARLVLVAWVGKLVLMLGLGCLALIMLFDSLAFLLPLATDDDG